MSGISPYRAVNTFYHGYKSNHLTMYKGKAAVSSEMRTKYSTQSEQHINFFKF